MTQTIVILHGWGISGEKYHAIKDIFEKDGYHVIAPDFPGFGKTPLEKEEMHLDDYVRFLEDYLEKRIKDSVILIGHSFGGRVAAKFSAKNPKKVKALILTGAPLIKKPLSFKKQVIQMIAKNTKKLIPSFLEETIRKNTYRFLGEWDYYKAGQLKKTLRNILAEDILPSLSHIKAPTLIIWGEEDTFVSLTIGKEISKKITGAKLEVVENGTHKLPYENPTIFAEKVL